MQSTQQEIDRRVRTLEGTIARINYRTGELLVVTRVGLLEFTLSRQCRLWFNGNIAPLRCFHSLDRVQVVFVERESGLVAESLHLWDEKSMRCENRQFGIRDELEI